MKKNRINAFTLVEMLIVIVIIGILIAALMPRMQAAQWRARDVSRKTALSQIQSAIVVYQWDHWEWPLEKGTKMTCNAENIKEEGSPCKGKKDGDEIDIGGNATNWISVWTISSQLKEAWMSGIPVDPLKAKVTWLWNFSGNDAGDYAYLVATRNWTPNWGFALMAKTEVVWWSNWVVCETWNTNNGKLSNTTDLSNDVTLCKDIIKGSCSNDTNGTCSYENDSQLRYLLVY